MNLQIIQQILGIILFFLPGILLSYIVSRKADSIQRAIYSILLAPCISVIAGIILYHLNLLNQINMISVLIFLNMAFLLAILSSNKKCKTSFNKDFFYLILFSLIGVLWRLRFLRLIKNFQDSYNYAFGFSQESVPDLGFYTGMAIDHARFIGINIFHKISEFLFLEKFFDFLGTFLITFLFLGFVYLIFCEYRDRKLAFIGVALMSLGPIELFYTTSGFFEHSFSYLALFSLFLLYKTENKKYFLVPMILVSAMAFIYMTSSMVTLFASIGFIVALVSKAIIKNKKLPKMKIFIFMLISIISISFVFYSYSPETIETESSGNLQLVTKHITSYALIKYKDPVFLGLSAIRWQMLFFFLCGMTFIFYIIKKIAKKEKIMEKDLDLLLCLIPVLIVSSAFFYVNLPARIFNYFSFFGLLVLKIHKKYLKVFFVLSFIFLLLTGFYIAEDKKVFFETSDKEIEGALWINNTLKGRIFSDQVFVNQLVLAGYYNVTGVYDDDIIVYNLFYQNDSSVFLNTANNLSRELGVTYIAITKRMEEKYILMLNVPQKPLINIELYQQLNKIYDNGEVKVYDLQKGL